jgi:hypothetical protein
MHAVSAAAKLIGPPPTRAPTPPGNRVGYTPEQTALERSFYASSRSATGHIGASISAGAPSKRLWSVVPGHPTTTSRPTTRSVNDWILDHGCSVRAALGLIRINAAELTAAGESSTQAPGSACLELKTGNDRMAALDAPSGHKQDWSMMARAVTAAAGRRATVATMPAKIITDTVRRQLWWRAGRRCAFPDCQQMLFATGETDKEVYVGHECHIVAQKDDPKVARAPSTLTEDEKVRWAHLIDDRHGTENLVLMCQTHSKLVDTPGSGYTVDGLVEIKKAHENAVAAEDERERSGRYDEAPASGAEVRVLLIDDVDEWERASIRALAAHDQSELSWLTAAIGAPSDGDRCEALIRQWPDELASGSVELKMALARAAERDGRWASAARAWELAAADTGGARAADLFARAAIASGTAGGKGRAERLRLLDLAEDADADSLRLRLAKIDDDGPPDRLLAELLAMTPGPDDDRGLVGQLHLQRARAAMLSDDLGAAESHFAAAEQADPGSLATRMMGINVVIQRGRVGVRDDRDFPAGEVRDAIHEALHLRSRLVEMRRFGESGRMLMLAADGWGVLRDPARARPLLESALDDELATEDGPHVLGDSALRCGQSDLALRFIAGRADEASRRIAATARGDLLLDPSEPLAELEQIATAGGPEATMAAAARLGACLPPIKAPFSEPAAQVLEASNHAGMATGIRVLTLARTGRHTDAEQILDGLPKTPWSAELRLRAAGLRGAHATITAAAEELLKIGPDPAGRLLAGQALARAGAVDRGQTELVAVAQSASAPPVIRSEAYAAALRLCADEDDWGHATTLFRQWSTWAASNGALSDGRISAWQVRIYHHGGYSSNVPS